MIRKIRKVIATHNLIERGDLVVAGLSGGADSVCLLLLLCALKDELGFSVKALHVNHCLRGAAADEDEAYVRALCVELGVELEVYRVDVAGLADQRGLSTEEAGRDVRYELLKKAAGDGKIAVAHHSDDNCETVLYNIMRGTGLKGLSGIPVKNGRIIRPLLYVSRAEIEEYLTSEGRVWRTDETNLGGEYTRNRIRNELLPMMETRICSGAREHILNLAKRAGEAEELIEGQAADFCEQAVSRTGDFAGIPLKEFSKLHTLIAKRVLEKVIEALVYTRKDITAAHLDSLYSLREAKPGAQIALPYGLSGYRDYDKIILTKDYASEERAFDLKVSFHKGGYDGVPPEKKYTKWLDYDKIKCNLVIRTRQSGDRISLDGVGRKSLNRYMIDEKIPARLRDRLPVLADGENIVWIPGFRIGGDYKVTPYTKSIIEITIRYHDLQGEEDNG